MATEKQRLKKAMPVSPGRPKGVPNKATKALKESILLAAENVGEDGKGKNGLVGYLISVAKSDKKAFSTLLGKVLPLQLTGPNDGPLAVVYGDVNSMSDQDLVDIIKNRNPKIKNAKPNA